VLSSSSSPETGESTRWTAAAYPYALVAAAGFGYFLFAVPVQLTDSLGNLVQVRAGDPEPRGRGVSGARR
jgi:hypothetical protein